MFRIRTGKWLVLAGLVLYIIFALFGVVHVGIFLIFPFFISSSPLSIIPFAMIVSGILLMFMVPIRDSERGREPSDQSALLKDHREEKGRKYGGLIMIGPIPIIFGNDRKVMYVLAAIAAVILLILFLYYLRGQ